MPIEIREIDIKATVDDTYAEKSTELSSELIEEIIQEALHRFSQIQKEDHI